MVGRGGQRGKGWMMMEGMNESSAETISYKYECSDSSGILIQVS
jgi:hypothetical protein